MKKWSYRFQRTINIGIVIILMGLFLVPTSEAFANLLNHNFELSEEERELMQSEEVYTVGYSNNNIPISYTVQGELTGITVDLLEEFADAMGITFEYKSLDSASTDVDELDLILPMPNFTIQQVSDTYMTYFTMLVMKSTLDKEIEVIATQSNFGLTTIDPEIEGKEILYFNSFAEAKNALDTGAADALLMASIGYEKIGTEVDEGAYVLQALETPINFRLIFSDDFPEEKIAVFNHLISQIDSGNLSLLGEKHGNYIQRTYTIWDTLAANINIIGGSFFVGIFTVTTIVLITQKRKRKALEEEMDHDSLTGLLSLRKFKAEVGRVISEYRLGEFHILALDMDNFKYINEIYGYDIGTKILVKTAECMKSEIKCVEDIMARTYADNFLVLATGSSVFQQMQEDVEGYSRLKAELSLILGKEYNFSFSLGMYTIKDPLEDINQMIDNAIIARSIGKHFIGYTITEYTEEMKMEQQNKNNVIQTMNQGIRNKEFIMYYQPKIDLQNDKIIGAEALVRWNRGGKLVPPNSFIPIFEKNGFIETLDYYVITEVCSFIKKYNHIQLPIISVNLSWITIKQDGIVENIQDILNNYGVKPTQLDLEITESAFVDQVDESLKRLEKLRNLGFTISMDDFGAGISCLNRLKELPLDCLKIDRAFIVDSFQNEKGLVIIENVIHMAKDLNLETVAEGIETIEQRDFLRNMGCDIGQGYFYERPITEDDFIERVQ